MGTRMDILPFIPREYYIVCCSGVLFISRWSGKISPTVCDGRANRDRAFDGLKYVTPIAMLFCFVPKLTVPFGESCGQCQVHSHLYGLKERLKKKSGFKDIQHRAGYRGHELGRELNVVGNGLQGRQRRQGIPHCP